MKIIDLKKGDFLYRRGDTSTDFYFLLKGKLELLVEQQNQTASTAVDGDQQQQLQFKFSKIVDESEFFGMKEDLRSEYARVVTDKA